MSEAAAGRPQLGIVPYIVAGCMFMENLDATVIVTALPTMARDFGTDTPALGLGVSAYMIAVAIVLPLGGWLAERLGARTVMSVAILLFALTSLWCGIAEDLQSFVLARVGQGAAAALMVPVGRLVVLRGTPKDQLVHAIAILVWPALVAPVIGPPLGGFLTSFASWRWIFYLNLPIAAFGLILAWRFMPNQRSDAVPAFDWTGYLLVAVAMGAAVAGLEMTGSGATFGIAVLAFGFAAIVLAVRHLRNSPIRLFSLEPARIQSFAMTTLTGGALTRLAITATPFLLPLMFQAALGLSAFEAGALMLVYFVGNLAMKLVTTRLLRSYGFRSILLANGAVVAVSIGLFALTGYLPMPLLLGVLFLAGSARSMQFTAINTLTFADVPPKLTSDANTLNGLAHQLSVTAGVVGASLLLQASGDLDGAAFAKAFLTMAAIAGVALLFYASIGKDTGQVVSGHSR